MINDIRHICSELPMIVQSVGFYPYDPGQNEMVRKRLRQLEASFGYIPIVEFFSFGFKLNNGLLWMSIEYEMSGILTHIHLPNCPYRQ